MPTPKERLSHLLELASQGAEQRAALGGEVADLLLDWPAQYSPAMRATFEALLEKIAREMEPCARGALAVRFEGRNDAPLELLNELFLAAPAQMKDAILTRNDAQGAVQFAAIDHETLLATARARGDMSATLTRLASIPETIAQDVMSDRSGISLAALAKGTQLSRATFSAVVILSGPVRAVDENFALLSVFDEVPPNGAARLVAFWQAKAHNSQASAEAAA